MHTWMGLVALCALNFSSLGYGETHTVAKDYPELSHGARPSISEPTQIPVRIDADEAANFYSKFKEKFDLDSPTAQQVASAAKLSASKSFVATSLRCVRVVTVTSRGWRVSIVRRLLQRDTIVTWEPEEKLVSQRIDRFGGEISMSIGSDGVQELRYIASHNEEGKGLIATRVTAEDDHYLDFSAARQDEGYEVVRVAPARDGSSAVAFLSSRLRLKESAPIEPYRLPTGDYLPPPTDGRREILESTTVHCMP